MVFFVSTSMIARSDTAPASEPAVRFRDTAIDQLEKSLTSVGCDPHDTAKDEAFWVGVRESFALHPTTINFNNGGCSPSPRVVVESLKRQIDYANQSPSIFMWRDLDPKIEGARASLAKLLGVDTEEVAITRNASESLITCLLNLPMAKGDEILTTSQDYPRMINAIKQRERREGIKMVQVEMPVAPETREEIVEAFERAITPRTKMILVSHVIFLTGEIYPFEEICQLGRKYGIPVVVDGAHAVAHFPFTLEGTSCDYYGTSLHKWLMAPIGTGVLYVRKPLIEGLWSLLPPDAKQDQDIRKFEEIGTHQAAVHNAIAEALEFHEMLGADRKLARLRYLASRWSDYVLDCPNVRFHTNLNSGHSGAIRTVEIVGIPADALRVWLEEKYQIVVAGIDHPQFQGLRVSPQVYTSIAEADLFGQAMQIAATQGIS